MERARDNAVQPDCAYKGTGEQICSRTQDKKQTQQFPTLSTTSLGTCSLYTLLKDKKSYPEKGLNILRLGYNWASRRSLLLQKCFRPLPSTQCAFPPPGMILPLATKPKQEQGQNADGFVPTTTAVTVILCLLPR